MRVDKVVAKLVLGSYLEDSTTVHASPIVGVDIGNIDLPFSDILVTVQVVVIYSFKHVVHDRDFRDN